MEENTSSSVNGFVPVSQITVNGTFVKTIMYKNNTAVYLAIPIALGLILIRHVLTIITGLVILAAVFFALTKVKDRRVVEMYDDCLVIYDEKDPELARKLLLEDIYEWTIRDSNQNASCAIFTMNYGERVSRNTFQLVKCYNTLRDLMPDKESRIRQLNYRGEKVNSGLSSITDIFKRKK